VKTSIVYLIIGLLLINSLKAQVKIGNNPQNLHPASVLELESPTRVLVITRVTDAQMSVINPLPGAVVYNTDQDCLHYYNGTQWINICEALDNSFTVSTRPDYFSTINPAQSKDSTVVISQTENPDGSINYNYEVGLIRGANIVNTTINGDSKIQAESITTQLLAPRSVTIGKFADAQGGAAGDIFQWNGSQWTLVNESVLGITEKDSIVGNEVVGPFDSTLTLEGDGDQDNPYTLDVAPLGIDTPELADDAVTTLKILDGNITNAKLDKTNIPLSGFGAAMGQVDLGNNKIVNVDNPTAPLDAVNLQYLESAITASEALDNDIDETNELQDLTLATNILTLTNPATAGNQVDLTPYLDDTTLDEAAVDAFVANNGYLTAEVDGSTTNELQDLDLTTNILTLSNPSTPGNQIDLTPYLDDTTLDEAAVDAFVANNGYLTAEVDGSTTNELQDLDLTTNILTLSSPSTPGNQIDLTPYLDNTTLATSDLTQTASTNRNYNINNGNLIFGGTGNVGIGITPTQKLHVDGNILATGTITPDYVFQKYFEGNSKLKPSYQMLTLKEIEEFTRKNKHLPGVPSASEVKRKGGVIINRATEINLEKIEELFLYTIEQEKKIKKLQSNNENLTKELDSLKAEIKEIKTMLLEKSQN